MALGVIGKINLTLNTLQLLWQHVFFFPARITVLLTVC